MLSANAYSRDKTTVTLGTDYEPVESCVEINGCDANIVEETEGKFKWTGEFIKMVNEGKILPDCRFACKGSKDKKERKLHDEYMSIRKEYHAESKHYAIAFDPNDQIEIEKLNAEEAAESENEE
jgi:hypothetical protein